MIKIWNFRKLFLGRVGVASVLATSPSYGAPCTDLSDALVVAGSTALKPLLEEVAKLLVASGDPAGRVYYAGSGSCAGIDAILTGAELEADSLTFWDETGSEQSCSLDPDTIRPRASIGVSDVFPSSCGSLPNGLPGNIRDFLGPVQTMTFVVPQASSQNAISAEAAYYVFGFGAESGVAPWTDPAFIFQRSSSSGTQSMIAKAIGVDAERWRGTPTTGSSDLRQRLLGVSPSDADKAIGILSTDHADENRATLRVLAYQDFDEDCAILPDRTARSNEKQNVRNGSYPIWGPMHLLTTVDESQRPTRESAATLIGLLTGSITPPAGLDLITLQAQRHIVPQCAMRVQRGHELGPAMAFSPAEPCGCYYEEAANGVADCTTCRTRQECGESEICSFGYCEAP